MKKTKYAVVSAIFVVMLLSLPVTALMCEKIVDQSDQQLTNKCDEETLEVVLEVLGSNRIYPIGVSLKNNGDEPVTVTFSGAPGGGFRIYDENNVMVYLSPEYVLMIIWETTLAPSQTILLFTDTWLGVDSDGKPLEKGSYSVKGFASLTDGEIYSEPVDIDLPKTRVKNLLAFNFLARFPLFARLLPIISKLLIR